MIIKIQQDSFYDDIEVTVKCGKENEKAGRIVELLRSVDMRIKCDRDGAFIHKLMGIVVSRCKKAWHENRRHRFREKRNIM